MVDARSVLKCPACELRQFETKSYRTYVSKLETHTLPITERIAEVAAAYGTTPSHLMRMVEYLITGR